MNTRFGKCAVVIGLMTFGVSCAGPGSWRTLGWATDYATAEVRAAENNDPLLIYYDEARPGVHDELAALLKNDRLQERTQRYQRCKLFRDHEPDRRFVAQYGVRRAPALIVIHPDGTYHALEGRITPDAVLSFLDAAAPPGVQPVHDANVPYPAEYAWESDLEDARQRMEQTRRPMLVVLSRPASADAITLNRLLGSWLVYRLVGDWVHCRQEVGWPWSESARTPFGTLRLPAAVFVGPDGRVISVEAPESPEDVARGAKALLEAAEGATPHAASE